MSADSSRIPPHALEELHAWINGGRFTHFVSLATNEVDLCGKIDRLDRAIKSWDARINRELLGPKWAEPLYRAERMFAFYFLEKPKVNPHWHGLIRIDESDPNKLAEKHRKLHARTAHHWQRLAPKGSTDIQEIYDQEDIVSYVAKELRHPVSYEHFVVPDMFDSLR